jgi:hypothetical protein
MNTGPRLRPYMAFMPADCKYPFDCDAAILTKSLTQKLLALTIAR